VDVQIPDEQLPTIIRALEHYADYLKAMNRDDRVQRDIAESLERKPAAEQHSERTAKRKRA